jgi:hypothetical protein
LSNVRGTACTIFCEIMMSTLVSLKSLWLGEVGRCDPPVMCYDAIKDTWYENRGFQIQVGHMKYILSVYWCVHSIWHLIFVKVRPDAIKADRYYSSILLLKQPLDCSAWGPRLRIRKSVTWGERGEPGGRG